MAFGDVSGEENIPSVRLNKLNTAPTSGELDFALSQAKQNRSVVVELPWKAAASPATFVLKVSCSDAGEEPTWSLHKGETIDSAVLWSFDSEDTSLIVSLIAAECDPDRSFESAATGAPSAPAAQPSAQDPSQSSEFENISQALMVQQPLPPPVELDREAVESIERMLKDPRPGLTNKTGFFFFMIREFARFQSMQTPFSLIVLDPRAALGGKSDAPLPERGMAEAVQRIVKSLRPVDVISAIDDHRLIILAPGLSPGESGAMVRSFERELATTPLMPGLDSQHVFLFCGIAGVPATCQHPGVAIAAAIEASSQARERKVPMMVFPSGASA